MIIEQKQYGGGRMEVENNHAHVLIDICQGHGGRIVVIVIVRGKE